MKIELGALNCLYPMPTTLVGAMVEGRPNFITIAHVGIMDPGSLSLGMSKAHYTNAGIKQYDTFSVNLPSAEMVQETDYCGLVSGRRADKTKLFSVFYGTLKTAPMIVECPISMECKLTKVVDFPKHDIFIGEIVATYAEETVLTDGVVDYSKVQPFFFTMTDNGYWRLGERFAQAWSVGKVLEKKQKKLTSAQQYDYCNHAYNASSQQLNNLITPDQPPILVKPISAKLVKHNEN